MIYLGHLFTFLGLMRLITTEDDVDINDKENLAKVASASQLDLGRVVEVVYMGSVDNHNIPIMLI